VARRLVGFAGMAAIVLAAGCRSPYVSTTVKNDTGAAVTLVEVDYPSASFGRESLAAGAVYPYRFKVLGSGVMKVSWTDAARKEHTATGPDLHEGQKGLLTITLTPEGAQWSPQLTP
jgi:hypothetical protein